MMMHSKVSVNCDQAVDFGLSAIEGIIGKPFADMELERNTKCNKNM